MRWPWRRRHNEGLDEATKAHEEAQQHAEDARSDRVDFEENKLPVYREVADEIRSRRALNNYQETLLDTYRKPTQ